ncbi:unnamed protein product [Durusdinium trenchii]|uniref:PARP-type domain-containing protein n=1 Tax=Durusdinium trenchii TaxID=1381693 RepID=A0ABP0NP91_9DINO
MPFSDLWDTSEQKPEGQSSDEELRRLRRSQRTAKAREAAAQARVRKQFHAVDAGVVDSGQTQAQTRASILQSKYFTRRLFSPGISKEQDYQKIGSERGRCVFSLVQFIVELVKGLFTDSAGQPKPVEHIINAVIADDTDTRMKGAGLRSTIHTVCNTVQAVHVRMSPAGKDELWVSTNIPTPMLVLSSPQCGNIHAASTAMSIVCGAGIGSLLGKFGVSFHDVTPHPRVFRTEVMVGDALQANQASWKLERQLLASLRSQQGIQVTKLPEDSSIWKARAQWISRNFDSPGKIAKENLESILEFCNGDTCSPRVIHWCCGCCDSDEQALSKVLRLLVPLMGKGYPTPFLSRFKHFGPAISYIRVFCTLHGLLPRILLGLKDNCKPGAELVSMVDALLADTSISSGNFTEEDMQALVGGILDADVSYSVQNSVRKNMMIKAISAKDFDKHAVVMACVLGPIDYAINYLFSRTKALHQIANVGSANQKFSELVQKSRARFLHTIGGDLGRDLMRRYLGLLQKDLAESIDMGLDISNNSEVLHLAFNLILVGMSDSWRRLVHEFSCSPWNLFSLVGCDTATCLDTWRKLQEAANCCKHCLDDTFTCVLLSQYPYDDLRSLSQAELESVFCEVRQLLLDLAGTIPLSSDLVEVKNGVVQYAVSHRGKTQVKSPPTARETTFLQSCIKQFDLIQPLVQADTMPSKKTSSSILKMSGVQSTNQYSKDSGQDKKRQRVSQETPAEKTARLEKATSRKLRSLSGWNVFQKCHMEGAACNPSEYRIKLKEISAAWKALDAAGKEPYNIQAAHQQELRNRLAEEPLAAQTAQAGTAEIRALESQVDRNARKKLAARRLQLNVQAEAQHSWWTAPTQYADSSGALRKSAIDLATPDEDIQKFLQSSLHSDAGSTEMNSNDSILPQCLPGHCVNDPLFGCLNGLAKSFKHELSQRKLKPGTLLCFSSSLLRDSFACLLGVSQKKPILQTLMHVTFQANSDILFELVDGVPQVSTSHHLFRKFVGDATPNVMIDVQVWSYHMKWIDNRLLIASADELRDTFTLTSKPEVKKTTAPPQLLSLLKAARKRESRKNTKGKTRKTVKKVAQKSKASSTTMPQKKIQGSDSSGSESDSDSDSCGDQGDDIDLNAEANPIEAISDTVLSEQVAAKELEKEIAAADEAKEAAITQCQKGVPASSFFAKELGVLDVAFAASGRSTCLQCKLSINKNAVRFSWYHSRVRPHGWVHAECLFQIAVNTGLKEETRVKVKSISERSFGASEGNLQVEALRVLRALQS